MIRTEQTTYLITAKNTKQIMPVEKNNLKDGAMKSKSNTALDTVPVGRWQRIVSK
jgi:hypothetical protein